MLYRRDTTFSPVRLNTALQAVAGRVFAHKAYTICSVYLPPNEDITIYDLEHLIRQLPRPFVLLGDMNARHYLWGDSTRNGRGDMIVQLTTDYDLAVMNTGEPTHYHVQTGSLTMVDLTICTPDVLVDFTWEVSPTLRGSDHYPITVQTIESAPQTSNPKWCLQRADWDLFQRSCHLDLKVHDHDTIDEAVEYFVAQVHRAAAISIPRTSSKFHRRPVPWWNNDCAQARLESRRAESRLKSRPDSQALKIEFLRCRARYRRIMKMSRQKSWQSYVSSINASTPIAQVWKRVSKMKRKSPSMAPPIISLGGREISQPTEVVEAMAEHFASVSCRVTTSSGAQHRFREERRSIDFSSNGGEAYNALFDSQELREALRTCDDTAPGPDDLPYALIRNLDHECRMFLLDLYNRIWEEGSFPASWRVAIVIPIAKPGKEPSDVNSYRPISLTSCLCKLFEKMVNYRLVWVWKKKSSLHQRSVDFGNITPPLMPW